MRFLICACLLAVWALTAVADTDVSGKWSGSFDITTPDGQVQNDVAFFVFKQAGTELTGTVGPNEEKQFPITKGKIEDGKITIEADNEGHTIKLDLVLSADRITGDARMEAEGQTAKAKVNVTRVKQ